MRLKRKKKTETRVEIMPLIDVVFLLLVFFIYAMLSMVVHRGLTVDLPTSSSAEKDTKLTVSITIKSDGTIYVDKEKTDLENITDVLIKQHRDKIDIGVSLLADKTADYQKIFTVLDQIKAAGISNISLQSYPEAE